jgi:hypothetical protein
MPEDASAPVARHTTSGTGARKAARAELDLSGGDYVIAVIAEGARLGSPDELNQRAGQP